MINLVLFGPPGAGKGTQAVSLVEKYNLYHLSTGDVFRYNIGQKTELGMLAKSYMDKGDLVPDEVTIKMLKSEVEKQPGAAGFIFDGFPRTVAQAEALDAYLSENDMKIDHVLALEVPDEELVKRLLNRGKTSGRADDQNEEIVWNRIKEYNDKTAPLKNFYADQSKLRSIDGVGGLEEIFDRLVVAVG
ncbi:adenylate kinase [bacterium SCSIO 12643]|nr:adenylate kinase [bacterium SCSIO 12643]